MSRNFEEYSREELIDEIKKLKRQKRFGLVWEDKPEKVVKECEDKLPVLKEVEEKASGEINSEPTNIIIEGDNYHALSILNYTHTGKIDVIYIDPPYNTGNKDFIYNDCYVDKEDTFRHSKWLSFMEKRMKLAKNLLADDGVIFISIDDNEQSQLKMLCDSIFGENNFVSNSFVLDNLKGKTNDSYITSVGSRLIVYCKVKKSKDDGAIFRKVENIFADKIENKYKNEDEYGLYNLITFTKTGQSKFREDRPNMYYPILMRDNKLYAIKEEQYKRIYDKRSKSFNDDYVEELRVEYSDYTFILPKSSSGEKLRWTSGYETFCKKINEDVVYDNGVKQKTRPDANELLQVYASGTPKSLMYKPSYSMGTQDLSNVLPKVDFDFPKPIQLIKDILLLINNNDLVILDFFAGSGTTGQAVMELNKEDGGHRQFILVTNNEANGKADAGEEGIAEKVTYPRIKTVITGIRPDGSKYSDGLPANLRYFKTDFVEKGKTTDDTREALITECCDMIRIRENAFEHVANSSEYRFYKNDKVFVPIIFDQFAIAETWEKVEELNTEKLPVHCYNFSYNRHANEEEIPEDTKLEWTACSIPESVLEVYKRIFRKKEN